MRKLLDRLGQFAQVATSKLSVKSAINPILWICIWVTPLCLWIASFFKETVVLYYAITIVALLPPITGCIGFLYFMVVSPEKLQSEEYQIRHEALAVIQQKTGKLLLSETSLEAIANPHVSKQPPPTTTASS